MITGLGRLLLYLVSMLMTGHFVVVVAFVVAAAVVVVVVVSESIHFYRNYLQCLVSSSSICNILCII